MHPSSVNHERFASAAESGRQVRRRCVRVRGGGACLFMLNRVFAHIHLKELLITLL